MSRVPPPNQGPVSYKTVPNRNKTQKWQQARTYNYDGDEWGGYDAYDEYGANEEPPVPPPAQLPQANRNASQPQPLTQATAATAAGGYGQPLGKIRTQSFDRGDERRQFSAPPGYDAPSTPWMGQQRQPSPARSAGYRPSQEMGRHSGEHYYRPRQREFSNPADVPPPLTTIRPAAGPGPAGMTAQGNAIFPPRKQSISSQSSTDPQGPIATTSQPDNGSVAEKPLPFIRPSDIYKRMEEERERERASTDSSRPSMDSIQRVGRSSPMSAGTSSQGRQPNLESVTEQRESVIEPGYAQMTPVEQMHGINAPAQPAQLSSDHIKTERQQPGSPIQMLPPLRQVGELGTSWLAGDETSPAQTSTDNSQSGTLTRAPPGTDPANDILVERQASKSSSIQQTPKSAMSPTTFDDIAARHPSVFGPASTSLAEQQSNLQHQPSEGYRSVVHKAFDDSRADSDKSVPQTPASRDNSIAKWGGAGVSRSDTDSTSGISPIMSHVPSSAAPQARQQQSTTVDTSVPTIDEVQEPTSASAHTSRPPSDSFTEPLKSAKPPPVESNYRRSLEAPSSDNSPARTPALENARNTVLSEPLAAETINTEAADTADTGEPRAFEVPARRGTDFSVREADLAAQTSRSSEEALPQAGEADKQSRELFLETHPQTSSPKDLERHDSADQDLRLDGQNSAVSSKSSWSKFTGSPDRKDSPSREHGNGGLDKFTSRPELNRDFSFEPDLPGGWVASNAPTPAGEPAFHGLTGARMEPEKRNQQASVAAPRTHLPIAEEPIDLTPTTRKSPLASAGPNDWSDPSFLRQAKDAGQALGASLIGSIGIGHRTRDFANPDSDEGPKVDQPETAERPFIGEVPVPIRPGLEKSFESDASGATQVDVPSSFSEAPPRQNPNDTPRLGGTVAEGQGDNGYFGAVAVPSPLRPTKSRDVAPHKSPPDPVRDLKTTGQSDLDQAQGLPGSLEAAQQGSNNLPIFPAVPATENVHARGMLPSQRGRDFTSTPQVTAFEPEATEGGRVGSGSPSASEKNPRPGMLDQRFSWENASGTVLAGGIVPWNLQAGVGEALANQPEPPPSQLHVVNAEPEVDSPVEQVKVPASKGSRIYPEKGDQPPKGGLQSVDPSPVGGEEETFGTVSPSKDDNSPTAMREASALPAVPASAAKRESAGRIPPFRELMAIKDNSIRTKSYNDTREVFAGMQTGLSDWLSDMLTKNPEYANLSTQPQVGPVLYHSSTFRGHKPSASIAKLTGKLTGPDNTERKPSISGTNATGAVAGSSPAASGGTGQSAIDMDRMQAKGKDIMKSATVFGGKAQAGAKGLLAKGKSRFSTRLSGGDKAPSSAAKSRFATHAPVPAVDAKDNVLRNAPVVPDEHPVPSSEDSMSRSSTPVPSSVGQQSRSNTPAPSTSASESGKQAQHTRSISNTLRNIRDRSISSRSSGSRPLSLIWSKPERSETRESSSRSGSRPRSVINPAISLHQEDNDAIPERVSASYSPLDPSTTLPSTAQRAVGTEGWDEPGNDNNLESKSVSEQLPADVKRPSTPDRPANLLMNYIGVLPSPVTSTFPASPASTVRPTAAARQSTDTQRPAASPTTPTQNRKNSGARAALPSQQRALTSNSLGGQNQLDSHESQQSRHMLVLTSAADDGDEEDLYGSTPIKTKAPWSSSPPPEVTAVFDAEEPTFAESGSEHGDDSVEVLQAKTVLLRGGSGRYHVASAPTPPKTDELPSTGRVEIQTGKFGFAKAAKPAQVPVEPFGAVQPQESISPPAVPPKDISTSSAGIKPADNSIKADQASAFVAEDSTGIIETSNKRSSLASVFEATEMSRDAFHETKGGSEDDRLPSRRSSVSSLGEHHVDSEVEKRFSRLESQGRQLQASTDVTTSARPRTPPLSAQAVATGPGSPVSPMTPEMQSRQYAVRDNVPSPLAQRGFSVDASVLGGTQLGQQQQLSVATPREARGRRIRGSLNDNAPSRRRFSYEPVTILPDGGPMQDTHNQSTEQQDAAEVIPFDLSVYSGPPPGAPPFQRHPLLRNHSPSLTNMPRTGPVPYDEVRRASQTEDTTADVGPVRESPYPRIFRGAETSQKALPEDPPGKVTAAETNVQARAPRPGASDSGKRRSWLASSFKRTPSVANSEEGASSPNTRPPSRDHPTAVPSAKSGPTIPYAGSPRYAPVGLLPGTAGDSPPAAAKKKRFSGLANLFGRSNSKQGSEAKQRNKLTKQHSPRQTVTSKLGTEEQESGTKQQQVGSWRRDGETIELPRTEYNGGQPGFPSDQRRSLDQRRSFDQQARAFGGVPPPQFRYDAGREFSAANTSGSLDQRASVPPAAPQFRRLHSDTGNRERRIDSIPEAFRPVQSSYDAPIQSIGPPEPHSRRLSSEAAPIRDTWPSPNSPSVPIEYRTWPSRVRATGPPQQPYGNRGVPGGVGPRRFSQESAGHGVMPRASADYERERWERGAGVMPDFERKFSDGAMYETDMDGLSMRIDRDDRYYGALISGGPPVEGRSRAETTREPQNYWDGSIQPVPATGPDARYGEPKMWPTRRPSTEQQIRYVQPNEASPRRASMEYSRYVPPNRVASPPRRTSMEPGRPQFGQPSQIDRSPPPLTRGPSPYQYPAAQHGGEGPQQQHYYPAAYEPPRPGSRQEAMPFTYQRSSSGFSGRRDDMTVGEQEVLTMRGASYPGYGWEPANA